MKLIKLFLPMLAVSIATLANAAFAETRTIKPTSSESGITDGISYELVRLDWNATLKSGDHLSVINPWGNINVRQNKAPDATVHAVMQVIGEDGGQANLQLTTTDGQYTLEFIYPQDNAPDDVTEGRIDVALLLPENVSVSIQGDRGKIASKTVHVPLTVSATDQPVSIKTSNSLEISSSGGNLEVHLLQDPNNAVAASRANFKTISGDVNIRYYPDVQLAFAMISGRNKTTNDLSLLQSRQLDGRRVLMQHNNASETVNIQTDTGYIRLINTGSEFPTRN